MKKEGRIPTKQKTSALRQPTMHIELKVNVEFVLAEHVWAVWAYASVAKSVRITAACRNNSDVFSAHFMIRTES
jgi:hypothetical protein